MTRRKRRELEEQARLEEEKKAAEGSGTREGVYYPGVAFGAVNNCVLPVCNKQINAVQLPPIIQPISFIPFPMQSGVTETAKRDDFDDDFDDFEDWE